MSRWAARVEAMGCKEIWQERSASEASQYGCRRQFRQSGNGTCANVRRRCSEGRGPSNKKMQNPRPGTAETYLYLDEAGNTIDKRIMGDCWQQLRCQTGCRRELENSGLMFFLAC
jgi:hypothetical protein